MESGSHVCLGILVSDRPVVLNYQSDCLSTLFAWILISPNSVLNPSGECVGDGERKCACVCACLMYFVRHGSECVECRTRRFCQRYPGCGCSMRLCFALPVVGQRVRLLSHRWDTRVLSCEPLFLLHSSAPTLSSQRYICTICIPNQEPL